MYSNTPAAEYVAAGNAYSDMLDRADAELAAEHSRRLDAFDAAEVSEQAALCGRPDAFNLVEL